VEAEMEEVKEVVVREAARAAAARAEVREAVVRVAARAVVVRVVELAAVMEVVVKEEVKEEAGMVEAAVVGWVEAHRTQTRCHPTLARYIRNYMSRWCLCMWIVRRGTGRSARSIRRCRYS